MKNTDTLIAAQLLAKNAEIADLRARLEEAEETLRAIREGEVDAVIVSGSKGDRVFALSEADNLHRLMVETMNEAGLATTPDGLLVFCNDRAAALFGRAKEQLLGHDLAEFASPADAERVRQLLRSASIAPADARIEFRAAAVAPLPMHVWASRLEQPDSPLICLVATDLSRVEADRALIGQLQRQREQLRASEERLRLVLQASVMGTFEVDLVTGEGQWNEVEFELLGLKPGSVSPCPETFFRFVHPEDLATVLEKWEAALKCGVLDAEFRIIRADGELRWLAAKGQFVYEGPKEGAVAGTRKRAVRFMGVNFDITARQRAEAALRDSERRERQRAAELQTILDTAPIGLAIADDALGHHIRGNRANEQMFGLPPGAELSKAGPQPARFRIFQGGRELGAAELPMQRAGRGETVTEQVMDVLLEDGQTLTVYAKAAPVLDEAGRLRGAVGAFVDITALKQAEVRASRSQKMLSELIERSPFGTYVVDSQFRVAMMNTASQEAAFRNVRPIIGRPFEEAMRILWPEPVAAEIIGHFRHTLTTGESYYSQPFINPRHDAEIVEAYEWELHRMSLPDGQFGVVCYYYDSTKLRQAEAAVRESESRFRLALKNSPVLVTMQDSNLVYQWVFNTKTRRPEECVGKTDSDLFAPDEAAAVMAAKRRVLETGAEMRQAFSLTSNGQRVFLDCYFEPVRDADGRVIGVGGASVDLTEQKRAEAALVAAHRQTQDLIDNTTALVYACDLEERFVLANAALAALLRTTPAQLLGKRRHEFMPHSDADAHEVADRKAIASGRAVEFEEHSELHGRSITWLSTKFPLRDAQGRIYAVAGIVTDISARKQAEAALRAADYEKSLILDNTNEFIAYHDCANNLIWANKAYLASTNLSLADLKGRKCYSCWGLDRLCDSCPVATAIRTGQSQEAELTPQNQPHWPAEQGSWLVRAAPVRDDAGNVVGAIEVAHDITARKRAEDAMRNLNAELERRVEERTSELAATNRELEAFCYSVAHDLRAPLRCMDGFSQALLEDYGTLLDAAGRDFLNRVRSNTQRMGRLIDDLLNLSQIKHVHMRRTAVDLTAHAESTVAELRKAEPSRAVDVRIAPGLTAKGDPTLLGTALANLLENAWKFTGHRPDAVIEVGMKVIGHSSLGIESTDQAPMTNDAAQPPLTNDQAVFFVRDNGVGFDMRYAEKLFTPFQRLHAVTEFPGTGVGLATVQRVIQRHGGRVWFESAPGQGATFYFTVGANA